MARLNRPSRQFWRLYGQEYPQIAQGAIKAGEVIELILRELDASIHVITNRAKEINSLVAKLREKGYKHPGRQITDSVGVRIITHYAEDVDIVTNRLKRELIIDKRRSVDKREALGQGKFGYRSVHLIAKLDAVRERIPEYGLLKGRWFEIQIRSILEHAWAEIDHQIVYKSGIEYPLVVQRRFKALAATLELLEREFQELRRARTELITFHRDQYKQGKALHKAFDVAGLIAYLADIPLRPEIEAGRDPYERLLPPELRKSCVDALKEVGLGTPSSLSRVFVTGGFKRELRSFASARGIEFRTVSMLARIAIAIAMKNARVLEEHFPEITRDPTIQAIVRKHASK